jgi:hypothetical protein
MHSGKTTFANELVECHDFLRMAFADPVKNASVDMINAFLTHIGREPSMTRAQLDRDKNDLRWLLQGVGTELGRQYVGPDSLWVDLFREELRMDRTGCSLYGKPHLVVCDDCRFPNEIEALQEMGFTIIRIVRDERSRLDSIRSMLSAKFGDDDTLIDQELEKILSHPSETYVDELDADFSLMNVDGDLDHVRDVCRQLVIAGGALV